MIRRTELYDVDLSDVTTGKKIDPITPGDVLEEEFMRPLGISARALARDIAVPHNRILEILNGERAITPATAVLLGERFGTTAEFWMNLQTAHDLDLERAGRAEKARCA